MHKTKKYKSTKSLHTDKGISGSSPSSSSSSRGGTPKAAEGGLLLDRVDGSRSLGLGPCETILGGGGHSGLLAGAGVLSTAENVFTSSSVFTVVSCDQISIMGRYRMLF